MVRVVEISDIGIANQLHEILHVAFLPFRHYYTTDAFNATVVSAEILKERIMSPDYTVYGAYIEDNLAGTVSTKLTVEGDLYFMSMAVHPRYAGKGLGKALLLCIEEEAKTKSCKQIILETYYPLLHAIRLYESVGYHRTGMKRDYSGIEIFEMVKRIG